MPQNAGELIAGTVNALPLDRMFTVPAMAMATTQRQLSRQYYEFVKEVGLDENGNVKMVNAQYTESVLDTEGNVVNNITKTISVPLLSLLTHPNVNVQEGSVEFEMTIQSSSEETSETSGEGGFEATAGWGPFKVKVHGRMSHKSSQTRKTDTRARYAVNMKIAKDDMPEGMHQFLETVLNATSHPKIQDNSNGNSNTTP